MQARQNYSIIETHEKMVQFTTKVVLVLKHVSMHIQKINVMKYPKHTIRIFIRMWILWMIIWGVFGQNPKHTIRIIGSKSKEIKVGTSETIEWTRYSTKNWDRGSTISHIDDMMNKMTRIFYSTDVNMKEMCSH